MKGFKFVKIAALMTLFVLLFAGTALALGERIDWSPGVLNKKEVGASIYFMSKETALAINISSVDAYLHQSDNGKILKSLDFKIDLPVGAIPSADMYVHGSADITFSGLNLEYDKDYDIRLKSNDLASASDYGDFENLIGTAIYKFKGADTYTVSVDVGGVGKEKVYAGGNTAEVAFFHNEKEDLNLAGKFEWKLAEQNATTDVASGDGTVAKGVATITLSNDAFVGGKSYDLTITSGDGSLKPYETEVASFFVLKNIYRIDAVANSTMVQLIFFTNNVKDAGLSCDITFDIYDSKSGALHTSGSGTVKGGDAFLKLAKELEPGKDYKIKIKSDDPAIKLYIAYLNSLDPTSLELPFTVFKVILPTSGFWNLDKVNMAIYAGYQEPILRIEHTIPREVDYFFSDNSYFLFWFVPTVSLQVGKPLDGVLPERTEGPFIVTAVPVSSTDRKIRMEIDTSQAEGFPINMLAPISAGNYLTVYQQIYDKDILYPNAATASARAATGRGYSLDEDVWGWADVTIGGSNDRTSSGVGCDAGIGLFACLLAAGAALRRRRG